MKVVVYDGVHMGKFVPWLQWILLVKRVWSLRIWQPDVQWDEWCTWQAWFIATPQERESWTHDHILTLNGAWYHPKDEGVLVQQHLEVNPCMFDKCPCNLAKINDVIAPFTITTFDHCRMHWSTSFFGKEGLPRQTRDYSKVVYVATYSFSSRKLFSGTVG